MKQLRLALAALILPLGYSIHKNPPRGIKRNRKKKQNELPLDVESVKLP